MLQVNTQRCRLTLTLTHTDNISDECGHLQGLGMGRAAERKKLGHRHFSEVRTCQKSGAIPQLWNEGTFWQFRDTQGGDYL